MSYFIYIVKCNDNTLYTGITKDLDRRIYEHNNSSKGAKYTKSRRPVKIVYTEKAINRSIASKREYEIKQLKKVDKLNLIDSENISGGRGEIPIPTYYRAVYLVLSD